MDFTKYQADWKKAQNHGKSTNPGRKLLYQTQMNIQVTQHVCQCCNNFIYKSPQSLLDHSKQLDFLGVGFPVFYLFVKHCITLLLIMIACYNTLALVNGINDNQIPCDIGYNENYYNQARRLSAGEFHCRTWMIRLSKTQTQVTTEQRVIRIISYVVHLLYLLYMRDSILKAIQYFDQRTCSLSDYALMVKGIPITNGLKAKLQSFFATGFKKPYKIMDQTLLPYRQDCEQKLVQIKHLIKQYLVENNKSPQNDKKIKKLKQQITQTEIIIENNFKLFQSLLQKDELQPVKVILIFQQQKMTTTILEQFKQIQKDKIQEYFVGLNINNLQVTNILQPKQIIWEDINYPNGKRMLRIIIFWSLSALFIAVATLVFYFILIAKSHYLELHSQTDKQIAEFLVYLLILIVIFFNKFVMGNVLHFFTHMQKHQSTDKLEASFSLKYALGMFFTTALMTLSVEAISLNNFYTHLYGVIEQETVFFLFNAFFVPLIWIINPFQLVVLIKRKIYFGSKQFTQQEANHLMENFQYDMGKRYAQLLQTMWFTFLYATLIPLGTIITFIGLILYYWVDKYNLLRRSSVKSNMSGNLGIYALNQLQFTLLCRTGGQAIFDYNLRDGVQTQTIVLMCVSFVYLFLPLNSIIGFFNRQQFLDQKNKYSEIKQQFKDTYQTLHPVYSQMYKKQFRKKLDTFMQNYKSKTLDDFDGRSHLHSNTKLMV